jgi:hypothetical protein
MVAELNHGFFQNWRSLHVVSNLESFSPARTMLVLNESAGNPLASDSRFKIQGNNPLAQVLFPVGARRAVPLLKNSGFDHERIHSAQ